jgi:LEA14-like dessication related protein
VEAEHKMTTRIKLRRDTAANWTTTNPILAAGEPGLESDTGKIKYGDGVSRWNLLEHTGGDTLINEGAITVQTGDADRWFVRLRKEDEYVDILSGVMVLSTNYDSEGNALVVAQIDLDTDGIVVFKFTSAGELVWKKSVDGFSNNYYLQSGNAVVDSNDDLIFTAGTDSSVVTVVKVNGSTGAVEFSNGLDFGTGYNLHGIAVDSNDNIIVGGSVYLDGYDLDTAFVAKLNTDATSITWQKELNVDSGNSRIYSLAVDFNNDIVVTGEANVTRTVNGESVTDNEILVAKIAAAGTLSWQKTVALESDTPYGTAYGVSLDSIGNIYITGNYYVDNAESEIGPFNSEKSNAAVVFKMTTLGVIVWDRRIGPGPCSWVGVNTAVGSDGDLYIYANTYEQNPLVYVEGDQVGYYTSKLILARYNKETGSVIWQSYFDNPLAQEIPGRSNDGPWGSGAVDLLSVRDDKILIGGSVRFGQSDQDMFMTPWGNTTHFNQGFLAQFDTDATHFSADGWTLSTSRVPGKLTNTLVATDGTLSWQDTHTTIETAEGASFEETAAPVSVRRTASKVNTWTFGKDGTFTAPADANIKLQQTQLGFASIYGELGQDNESIWYNSVCHDSEGNAYTLGSTDWGSNKAYIQKFDTEGKLVWNRQLRSGAGASFNVTWVDNVYTEVTVASGGEGYKVGDRIVLDGGALLGNTGINSLTLEVATLGASIDFVGAVATVNIISGLANGTDSNADVSDSYDDAECEPVSMAFDPVTGNLAVLVSMPTHNGDTLDSDWTQAVVLMIDSGSGTVVKSFTLADEGDIYGYDIAVSATGKPAVVGEKYNEYNEYGTVTALTGSTTDLLWVAKADIDAEHFPGEADSYIGDWWITGGDITDQAYVIGVNQYSNLTGTLTARPGSGLVVDVTINLGNYTLVDASSSPGANYLEGQKFLITGDLLGGATPANDLTFTVGVTDGQVTSTANIVGTAGGPDQIYTAVTPTKVSGSGAVFAMSFSPIDGTSSNFQVTTVGQEYLVGDVVTIAGTSFAGGTTPANDIAIQLNSIDGGQFTNSVTITGTHPTTHLSIQTGVEASYEDTELTFSIKQSLGGEAFIWTPDFTKAIGGGNTDLFSGVVWDSTGANLYAVGQGRYDVAYNQGLVVKYSSTGTLLASKYINDSMGDYDATKGAVALMADNSIVVVHQMYNQVRDNSSEVLVTKLSSDLSMIWQQFIAYTDDGEDYWVSPDSEISVAVDPATDEILLAWGNYDDSDEINDDAIVLVKLDTDGQMIWKRMFGIHESDTVINNYHDGHRALSIHGDKFTIVGATDGPGDDTYNAFIATLPLDGSATGLHDYWTYFEPKDTRILVQAVDSPTSTTFTPNVHSDGITDTENVKYYYTDYPDYNFTVYPTVIRSNEGGAIEFADGSKQTFSAAIIPQVKSGENRYMLRAEDSGRHILVESDNYALVIPNWKRTTLPVGYAITIINISGNEITVETESTDYGLRGSIWFSGGDTQTVSVGMNVNGSGQLVTLIKFKEGTASNNGDDHGDLWMIAGADISDND